MKKIIYKIALFAVVAFSIPAVLSSCDKDDDDPANPSSASAKEYFIKNMLNQQLVVPLATDNSVDITAKFDGMTFTFTDTATFAGVATAANNLYSVNGTWSIDAAYNKITFAFPTANFTDLVFANKQWQFANRDSATIKLNAVSESDVLYFKKK